MRIYCRTFQTVMRIASYVLPWRKPLLLEGEDAVLQLPEQIVARGLDSVLLVTDQGIQSLGLQNPLLEALEKAGVRVAVYDQTVPNPTVENVEEALALYKAQGCGGIIAFGGGSPMDCAKGVGARVARPGKSIAKMRGLLKIRKGLPPLFAIPTTAGTGSEATVAAVISNRETHEKYALMDPSLIPHVAVLDPLLTRNLPPSITAATGMDALTHAVEAYIGRSNTRETREMARRALKLVFENLDTAYTDGSNIDARANMQRAAYFAGIAFTRAYVGNVHAIAHALGGVYGVPHGLANAVVLPAVLEDYGACIHKSLAELADAAGFTGDTDAEKSRTFIEAVRDLNARTGIPATIPEIREEDIETMAKQACREANPTYPVPRIYSTADFARIYRSLMG